MNSFTKLIVLLHVIGVECVCTTCDRCVNNTCVDPSKGWCFCVHGCKPGYFGQWCNKDCPGQCLTCGRNYEKEGDKTKGIGICYECNDGYHNGSSTNCLCPINCQQCTSTTQCTLCNQGWYGATCQSPCPTNCKDQICGKENGNCSTGCNDGWFSTKCDHECPNASSCKDNKCNQTDGVCNECSPGKHGSNCETDCRSINCLDNECNRTNGLCTNGCSGNFATGNDYLCQTCTAGKYGDACDDDCNSKNCKNNECDKVTGTCIDECIDNYVFGSDKLCQVCVDGKYGDTCDKDCLSSNCKNNKCDKITGTCIDECIDNYALGSDQLCQVCIAGKYGDVCDNDCFSLNCKNNKCDKIIGTCIDECIDNYVLGSDQLCYTCIPGKYGHDCNMDCSINCLNSTCNQDNGTCTNGCVSSSFIGDYCDKCKIGFYGSNCDLSCPSNCKDNVCTRSEGFCEDGCISENFDGNQCATCITGFYGELCTLECPINCRNNTCTQQKGECTYSCKGNFTGSKCDNCTNGYFGGNCNSQCPSNKCYHNKCIRDTGKCEQCLTSWYGELCDKRCSDGCLDNKCSILEGMCDVGCRENYTGDKCCVQDGLCKVCGNETYCSQCEDDYYGANCSTRCPQNCKHGCLRNDGHCSLCNRGYYGSRCENNCPDTCTNVTSKDICDFEDGTCLEGCVSGYFKNMCDGNCSTNCLDNVCNQTTGKCDACVAGFHGDTCQHECSTNCINVTCSQDNAECFHGCYIGFHGQTCQEALSNEDEEGNNIAGPVAGSVSTVIVAIVIGIIVLILLRKWKKKKDEDKNPMKILSSINDGSRAAVTDNRDANAVYQNETMNLVVSQVQIDIADSDERLSDENDVDVEYANAPLSTTNIKIIDLYTFVTQTEYEHFETEFGRLPRSTSHSYECARRPENRGLNRFKGMFPYDHSRVKLKHDPTFFINASYIDGYNRTKAYIASVGPTAAITNNFISFWTMVWYENVDKVVILTRLQEETGMKCERYWPIVGESKVYGDITVSHQEINTYAEYTITILLLEKDNQQRSLTHIHYTAWPDKTIPDNVVSLVEFYNLVNSIKSVSGGPTIVHCSAGVGRTGTFIALDILTEQGKSEKCVNVYECVMSLREQRMWLVQTHEQYEYLHRCLIYTLLFDSDPVTTDYVQSKLSMLDDRSYTKQFKMFDNDVERQTQDELEAIEGNKQLTDKNRPGADIPGNSNRPRLYLNRSFNQPDYINAVYVNSFKKTDRFIVAQTPLPETLSDFLCLLYQTKCTCVVDMDDPVEHNKSTIGVYQPEVNESIQVDTYTISCTKSETNSEFIKSLLKLKNLSKQNPGEITITHYKYTGWKQNTNVPESVNNFVQFVNTVQVATDNQTEDSPIIIHCLNGYERSGLFCTMSIMLEKLECEQQISIGNTIRQVRLRRNKAIPNKEQYKFCIQCIAAYTEMFNTYSNFAM